MKKSRFTESQIVAALKEGESGIPVADLCRTHGISTATYYQWKSKYSGVQVSELQRLRELEAEPNRCWALDFMHDALYCGRRFRTLNVIDEANRECLAIEVGTSIPSARLIRVLSRLVDCSSTPEAIRVDNGPEIISQAFTEWEAVKAIAVRYIQPGKPNQNAFIERFNRTYRTEVLDAHLFANLEQVQAITDQWLVDYNEYRPHESLGGLPPVQFMPRLTHAPNVYWPMST